MTYQEIVNRLVDETRESAKSYLVESCLDALAGVGMPNVLTGL